ncbi:MAG: DUF4383 domain-containing protein [Rivularia sp. (in: cyanobacteria)]
METRNFALIMGIVFFSIGIMGFIPFLVSKPATTSPELIIDTGYGYLMGLFPINILHNIVHLVFGIWGVGINGNFVLARLYSRSLAVIYGLLAIMGLIPFANILFGLIPIFGSDVWLHALIAVAGAYFGFIVPSQEKTRTVQ